MDDLDRHLSEVKHFCIITGYKLQHTVDIWSGSAAAQTQALNCTPDPDTSLLADGGGGALPVQARQLLLFCSPVLQWVWGVLLQLENHLYLF